MITMKITASTLSAAMAVAARVTETRNTIPILGNVHLKAAGGRLIVTTSDLDIWFSQTLTLESGEDMEATVDSLRFAAIIAACQSDVTMTLDNNRLAIKSGRSRWQLPVLPPQDFPFMPVDGLCNPVKIAGAVLASAIGRIGPAIADSSLVHPARQGVLFHPEADALRLCAMSEHRAMVCDLAPKWPKDAPEAIVPTKLVKLLAMAAAPLAGDISIAWSASKFEAKLGEVTLTGKLIDGQFPDYRRAVPTASTNPVLIDPDSMRGALKRVALVESEKTRVVKLTIGSDKVAISIHANSGDGAEEVPAAYDGDALVGFNVVYLGEMMDGIGGETVEMHLAKDMNLPEAQQVALFRRAVPDGVFVILGTFRI